jgi:hypothetical protein
LRSDRPSGGLPGGSGIEAGGLKNVTVRGGRYAQTAWNRESRRQEASQTQRFSSDNRRIMATV